MCGCERDSGKGERGGVCGLEDVYNSEVCIWKKKKGNTVCSFG